MRQRGSQMNQWSEKQNELFTTNFVYCTETKNNLEKDHTWFTNNVSKYSRVTKLGHDFWNSIYAT